MARRSPSIASVSSWIVSSPLIFILLVAGAAAALGYVYAWPHVIQPVVDHFRATR